LQFFKREHAVILHLWAFEAGTSKLVFLVLTQRISYSENSSKLDNIVPKVLSTHKRLFENMFSCLNKIF